MSTAGKKQPPQHCRNTLLDVMNKTKKECSDKILCPQDKIEELQKLQEEAEASADVLINVQQRCAAEYRALTALLEDVLPAFINPSELKASIKSSVEEIASIHLSGQGDEPGAEAAFGDEVVESAWSARAQHALGSQIRKVRYRSSRLADEISTLETAVQNIVPLKPPDSFQLKEWRAKAAKFEERTKILRKQISDMHVPSQYDLQKRFDEFTALKEEVAAARQSIKRYHDLPPSFAEADQKLQETRQELEKTSNEMKKLCQKNYGVQL